MRRRLPCLCWAFLVSAPSFAGRPIDHKGRRLLRWLEEQGAEVSEALDVVKATREGKRSIDFTIENIYYIFTYILVTIIVYYLFNMIYLSLLKFTQVYFNFHETSKTVICQDPVMGRELVVTQDVAAGEHLVKVPPELCIPVKEDDDDLGDLGEDLLGEDLRLARALAEVAESAYWEAYRDVWPSKELLEEMMPVV